MLYPSEKDFVKLSKKGNPTIVGNLIPVFKEIVADMETPVSAFRKIEGKYSFLLESVEGGEKIARYSFLGAGDESNLLSPKTLDEVREIMQRFKPVKVKGLPRFSGGLIGFLSYDVVREIENLPDKNPDELKLPLMQFLLADTLLAFDHVKHKILIISNAKIEGDPKIAYRTACKKISAIEEKLKQPLRPKEKELEINLTEKKALRVTSNFTKNEYLTVVKKAKEYIRAGDIIQVVPSQRLKTKTKASPFSIYRVLRIINPSPYMYYLNFGSYQLIGSSPEVMVRLENGTATVRPIAGTRPRGETEAEDKKMEQELLSSKKERAEHIMLVDLGRNDLGRVCEFGSVKVSEQMVVERYSHVMHIVSNVSGKIKKNQDAIDLLRATFPAGTVSGAPKVRAMEIIDELEKVKRGPYAGSVGYLSFSGDLDTAITIRTIFLKGEEAYVQAGGGVVLDSVPEEEYQETLNKARALLSAIEIAA